MRNVAESKPAVDAPESFGPDLYVICAETAFQVFYDIRQYDLNQKFFLVNIRLRLFFTYLFVGLLRMCCED